MLAAKFKTLNTSTLTEMIKHSSKKFYIEDTGISVKLDDDGQTFYFGIGANCYNYNETTKRRSHKSDEEWLKAVVFYYEKVCRHCLKEKMESREKPIGTFFKSHVKKLDNRYFTDYDKDILSLALGLMDMNKSSCLLSNERAPGHGVSLHFVAFDDEFGLYVYYTDNFEVQQKFDIYSDKEDTEEFLRDILYQYEDLVGKLVDDIRMKEIK